MKSVVPCKSTEFDHLLIQATAVNLLVDALLSDRADKFAKLLLQHKPGPPVRRLNISVLQHDDQLADLVYADLHCASGILA